MKRTEPAEERRLNRNDRTRRWLVGLGVFIVVFSGPTIIVQQHQNGELLNRLITSGNDHHAETVKQNAALAAQNKVIVQGEKDITQGEQLLITDHTQTQSELAEIELLQQQVATLVPIIAGLPTADAYLGKLAVTFITDMNNLCAGTGDCKPIPVPQP